MHARGASDLTNFSHPNFALSLEWKSERIEEHGSGGSPEINRERRRYGRAVLTYATPERNARSFNHNLAIARLLIYSKKPGPALLYFQETLEIESDTSATYFK